MTLPVIPTYLALLVGAAGGNLLNWGKSSMAQLSYLVRRRFTSTLIVEESQGETFMWLLSWCNEYLPATPHITALRRFEFSYLAPSPGTYVIRYQGKRVLLNRDTFNAADGNGGGARPLTRLHLTIYGRNRAFLEAILTEGERLYNPPTDKIRVHAQQGNNWGYSDWIVPRKLDSVILDPAILDPLVADMDRFLTNSAWYERLGIPYRRGYLLYGPPGAGKTSLAKALAGHFHLPLYVLNLGDPDLTDPGLSGMINTLSNAIVMLEDVDTVLPGRQVAGEPRSLTYSGVLNAIDGVMAGNGTILLMSTNHPEFLDPALVRPGRVDRRVLIDNPAAEQVAQMYERFFPRADFPLMAEYFPLLTDTMSERRLSMAVIQSVFMLHRDDCEAAALALLETYRNPPPVTLPPLRTTNSKSSTESVGAPLNQLEVASPRPQVAHRATGFTRNGNQVTLITETVPSPR